MLPLVLQGLFKQRSRIYVVEKKRKKEEEEGEKCVGGETNPEVKA